MFLTASLGRRRDLLRRVLAADVAAAAVGEDDRADHRHQQDQPGDLEREQEAAVEHLARARRCWAGAATGIVARRRAGVARADGDDDLGQQHQRDQQPERQVAGEARAQRREVDVEHHHHEQEQHRDRADVDDHQQHRDELGADQQHQPGGVEEGEDQPQHAVHRVAREDHRHRRSDGQRREQVKGEECDQAEDPVAAVIGTARRRRGWRRSPAPTCRRWRAIWPCRRAVPRGFRSRTRGSAPRRSRRPGRLPGTARNRCI